MKFSTKEDIEAPIDAVFAMVTDFEVFERSAMRRGAEVQRVDSLTAPGVGMAWKAGFKMRGRHRSVDVMLVDFIAPTRLSLQGKSNAIESNFDLDLLALSRSRTRMTVEFEVFPKTLPARLLVQSLKLAKSNLVKRFKLRVAEYAKDMEDRYQRNSSA